MCRSAAEGGQRCVSSTRPAYESASARLREVHGGPDQGAAAEAEDAWSAAAAVHASTPQGRSDVEAAGAQATAWGDRRGEALARIALEQGESIRRVNDEARLRLAKDAARNAPVPAPLPPEGIAYGMGPIKKTAVENGTVGLEDARSSRRDVHHLVSPIIGYLRLDAEDGEEMTSAGLEQNAGRLRHALAVADASVGEDPTFRPGAREREIVPAVPKNGRIRLEDAAAAREQIHAIAEPIADSFSAHARAGTSPTPAEMDDAADRLVRVLDAADASVGEEPQRVQIARWKAEVAAEQQAKRAEGRD